MAVRSSRNHVLPIEKVPLGFSLDLWTRTRPDLRTATMMTRGFSYWGVRAEGGGGDVGEVWNSVILMCVMYVSWTAAPSCQYIRKPAMESETGAHGSRPRRAWRSSCR